MKQENPMTPRADGIMGQGRRIKYFTFLLIEVVY